MLFSLVQLFSLNTISGILLVVGFQPPSQVNATPTIAKNAGTDDVATAIRVLTSPDHTCAERREVLSKYWKSEAANARMLIPYISVLKDIVVNEKEPLELRGDALNAIAACANTQQSSDVPAVLSDIMHNSELSPSVRLASAVRLSGIKTEGVDVDDVVTFVISSSGVADWERCEALRYCIGVVTLNPKETGEFHRRMLLLAMDETQHKEIRWVALEALRETAQWPHRPENHVDLASTQRFLFDLTRSRQAPDSVRAISIPLLCYILLTHPRNGQKDVADMQRKFASFLIDVIIDSTESEELRSASEESAVSMRVLVDGEMVSRLATALGNDDSKVVHPSVIATLHGLGNTATPAIPQLEIFARMTRNFKLRDAARSAVAFIASEPVNEISKGSVKEAQDVIQN